MESNDDGEDGTTLASTVAEGSIKITVTTDIRSRLTTEMRSERKQSLTTTPAVNVGGVELMFNDSLLLVLQQYINQSQNSRSGKRGQ